MVFRRKFPIGSVVEVAFENGPSLSAHNRRGSTATTAVCASRVPRDRDFLPDVAARRLLKADGKEAVTCASNAERSVVGRSENTPGNKKRRVLGG